MWKYLLAAVVLLVGFTWAGKTEITHPEHNVWSIATKSNTSGNSFDTIDVVRVDDVEQGVVCYLTITISFPPAIYCVRVK